jgi:hypothetical protein
MSTSKGEGRKTNTRGGGGLCASRVSTSGVNTERLVAVGTGRGGTRGGKVIPSRERSGITSFTLKHVCHHQGEVIQQHLQLHVGPALPPL